MLVYQHEKFLQHDTTTLAKKISVTLHSETTIRTADNQNISKCTVDANDSSVWEGLNSDYVWSDSNINILTHQVQRNPILEQ